MTYENKTQLNIFSLVTEQTVSTIQTTSAIRKFMTSVSNPTYKLPILQLDSTLVIVDLLTMEIETQIRTFCLEPSLLSSYNQSQAASIANGTSYDMRQVYDGNELRQKTDLLLMSSGFPIDFDVCQQMVAFVYTEINEESMVESLLKSLNQSSLGKNMYLKEAASKLVVFGHSSLETIGNLLNVNKASTLDKQVKEEQAAAFYQKQHCSCRLRRKNR